jgi:2,4-dienoyl-CoA reductase-like NADH-dependent reductase (Old Yellow Enzyme family)
MHLLFSPLALKNLSLPNRIVVAPMCQYSSKDGYANNWHLVHLGQYAIGKAGLIMQEATAVAPIGRITYADLGIWKDDHIKKLGEIVEFIHQQDSLAGIQLAHAGRKASSNKPWINRNQFSPDQENGWQTVGVSPFPYHEKDIPPSVLNKRDIEATIRYFKNAAKRSVMAGYDVVELHAAHGYLIHQFLSPLINNRTDEYGGRFENRIRFLLEIVQVVLEELKQQSLWVRISATDWAEGGWNVEESIELSKILKAYGVEVMDVSSAGAVKHQKIHVEPAYQVPFAAQIKKESEIITGAVGIITSAIQAESILQNQQADFISIARPFLRNPHLVYAFAEELNEDYSWANQYERGKEI